MVLLAFVLILPAVAVRAQDEDEQTEEAPARKGPTAAEAARNKGYHADDDKPAATQAEDDDAPAGGRPAQGSFTPPPPRQLGRSGSRANDSAGGGGGASSGAGISCEKSDPKLTSVIRKELNFTRVVEGPVVNWDVAPNEAISYRFKTPAAGVGTIFITMGHIGRPVSHLATLSQTACDFDVPKAKKAQGGGAAGQDYCYAWGGSEGGLMFQIPSAKTKGAAKGCVLKPNADYYFNIRSLSNPGQGQARDACADEIPFFNSRPELPRLCGGIWQLRWTPQ